MSTGVLNYFGPAPRPRRTLLGMCWGAIWFLIRSVVVTAWITIRAALLIVGFALLMLGSGALLLAGRRSAGRGFARWQVRTGDVMRLWIADILRPIRRWRVKRAIPVEQFS